MVALLLIANRGEIACRIARTCRRLGLASVAVHSAADAGARHVREADEALALEGDAPAGGYLDGGQILDAARRSRADAIHPGYGFLAENAEFAAACEAAGLRFVGPPAAVIREMGDKARARGLARAAGVPVVPGVEESDALPGERDEALCAAAAGLEYPLMVKACAGGGGRGLRQVDTPGALAGAIAEARAEARAGFGDDRLIVERLIERPRPVEVQVLGDRHGRILHLHERDCSVQRRHQKLVEECPAPGLAPATRDGLHRAALALAHAIGYQGAGTVEFVLDPRSEAFWFLEMNTRLQVEHPVTEGVLGIDLVEWQIRIAAGEPLTLDPAALAPRGWAMEARINAEDPAAAFRPAAGTVVAWRAPVGEGVRVDAGIDTGDRVAPHYDPLLAKVIALGRDRAEAARRLAGALDELVLAGVDSPAAFLADLVRTPAFLGGEVSTAFIEDHFPGGWQPDPAPEALARVAAAWVPFPDSTDGGTDRGPWRTLRGLRLLAPAGRPGRWHVLLEDDRGARHALWLEGHRRFVSSDAAGASRPASRART